MFVNLSPECRQQLLGLVQIMRMSEADVVAFAIQHLFEEKNAKDAIPAKKTRRKGEKLVAN
ncbi:MAG TPA: hypothetical protein VG099_17830 [Gemmataceae bacterium]|jgi:hypothetical protein|nr:hypothetical protein [Gemmataceae bacterium]